MDQIHDVHVGTKHTKYPSFLRNFMGFILLQLGNIISLFSSMFLCGPKRQFKNMFDKKRKVVTIVYLSTLLLSIIICFIPFDKTAKLLVLGKSNHFHLIIQFWCMGIESICY